MCRKTALQNNYNISMQPSPKIWYLPEQFWVNHWTAFRKLVVERCTFHFVHNMRVWDVLLLIVRPCFYLHNWQVNQASFNPQLYRSDFLLRRYLPRRLLQFAFPLRLFHWCINCVSACVFDIFVGILPPSGLIATVFLNGKPRNFLILAVMKPNNAVGLLTSSYMILPSAFLKAFNIGLSLPS